MAASQELMVRRLQLREQLAAYFEIVRRNPPPGTTVDGERTNLNFNFTELMRVFMIERQIPPGELASIPEVFGDAVTYLGL